MSSSVVSEPHVEQPVRGVVHNISVESGSYNTMSTNQRSNASSHWPDQNPVRQRHTELAEPVGQYGTADDGLDDTALLNENKWSSLVESVLQLIDGDGSVDPSFGGLTMSEVISFDNRTEVYALVRLPFSRHAAKDMCEVITRIRAQFQFSARKQTYADWKQHVNSELAKGGGKMFKYIDPKTHLDIDSTKFR